MRGWTIGAALLAAVLGAAGGGAAAYVDRPTTRDAGVAVPVPANNPRMPSLPKPVKPVVDADPVTSPPLETPTAFTRIRVGNSLTEWSMVKPKGWQAFCIVQGGGQTPIPDRQVAGCADSGVYFRPKGEPITGGYAFRVTTLSYHQTPAAMKASKVAGLDQGESEGTYADVQELPGGTDDTVFFDFLAKHNSTGNYLHRLNFFQWFTDPGDPSSATLEMSVTGRISDRAGLIGLFNAFAARLHAVG